MLGWAEFRNKAFRWDGISLRGCIPDFKKSLSVLVDLSEFVSLETVLASLSMNFQVTPL